MNRVSVDFHRPFAYPALDPKGFASYVARCRGDDYEGMLVCANDDGAVVGVVNLSQIFLGNFRSCYMGYYAGAPYAGQGLMTEGVGLALRHAFQKLKLHRVEANIQPGNEASLRLVRSLGFSQEGFSQRYLKIGGRWRDHERWALLADDWHPAARGR